MGPRRQRRRALSEDPDDFIIELPPPPSTPPPKLRRHTKPQIQEISDTELDPELNNRYRKQVTRKNVKDNIEQQRRLNKEFEEQIEIERVAEKALREPQNKLIEEVLREEIVEKRKQTAPISITSYYSSRKQRKIALSILPTQDPSLSSLLDNF